MANQHYNLAIIGHLGYDHVFKPGFEQRSPGGALFYSSMVIGRLAEGKRVAAVTKVAREDLKLLELIKQRGIECHVIPVDQTHALKVIYPTEDVSERDIIQEGFAGQYDGSDLPEDFSADMIYLAMNTNLECGPDLLDKLKGSSLAVDMQGFIRHVNSENHIEYNDVENKKDIVRSMEIVKLDDKEGTILTGLTDPVEAAEEVRSWGCSEVIITCTEGGRQSAHVVNSDGVYTEQFSNTSNQGRNGRGDTTFGAYLLRRQNHAPDEALRFACAAASIKMESPGPNNEFDGTIQDVLSRMQPSLSGP